MKIRHGFVTNSSSSSFILSNMALGEKFADKPYTVQEVRDFIKNWYKKHPEFTTMKEEGRDYIVSDSKNDDEIIKLWDMTCWDIENPEDCPLRREWNILSDLGIDVEDAFNCSVCPFNETCTKKESILDLCKEADVFVVFEENQMAYELGDDISKHFRFTYRNYHMG